MCERAKVKMQSKPDNQLGSWKRAVTSSDGCWLIRGFHSQCCTFVVIDFLTGGILYYGHLCMRRKSSVCENDLWQGTSKAAEGHLAYLLFKNEDLNVALNWQDQDSTAEISFRSIFPDGELNRVMLCGGHVGRSHGNNLKEYKGKKVLDKGFLDKYKTKHPAILDVKCCCAGKKHSKSCGCLSDDFVASAKRNHFSALKQSQKSPEEYARRMTVLGKYHCRDIHEWISEDGEEEECGFHPLVVCSCGTCIKGGEKNVVNNSDVHGNDEDENNVSDSSVEDDDSCNVNESDRSYGDDSNDDGSYVQSVDEDSNDGNEGSDDSGSNGDDTDCSDDESDSDESDDCNEDPKLKCPGKPYKTQKALHCKLHALLYEIECMRVAEKAKDIVDREMGRGHSNLPESKFNVLTRFRTKNVNLHQLHYEFITNIGLCQSNMTFMFKECGASYHWMKELYDLLHLPIPDGLEEIWKDENERRMKGLVKKKSDATTSARARLKQRRVQESKQRSKFVKRQKIVHNYGDEREDLEEEEVLEEVKKKMAKKTNGHKNPRATDAPKRARVNVGGTQCKCGSKEHSRISHSSCPLNKKTNK